jgi:hypothetical protein
MNKSIFLMISIFGMAIQVNAAEKKAERKIASETIVCRVADRYENGESLTLNDLVPLNNENLDGCPLRLVLTVKVQYSSKTTISKKMIFDLSIATLDGPDKEKCRYVGPSAPTFVNNGRIVMDTVDCEIN